MLATIPIVLAARGTTIIAADQGNSEGSVPTPPPSPFPTYEIPPNTPFPTEEGEPVTARPVVSTSSSLTDWLGWDPVFGNMEEEGQPSSCKDKSWYYNGSECLREAVGEPPWGTAYATSDECCTDNFGSIIRCTIYDGCIPNIILMSITDGIEESATSPNEGFTPGTHNEGV